MMDRGTTICYGQAKEWENRWDPIDVDLSAVTSLTSLGDFAFHDSKLDTVTLGATALGTIPLR